MCIIIFKPKRVPMPTLEIMKNCFEANPNGAGFMYRDDGVIHISKGYMTLEELLNAINLTSETINLKKTDVVIHFRISTHGSSIPPNTHPFPLSNEISDLKALNIICERAIAHNGILHEYGGFSNAVSDMSDTMYFAKMLSTVNDRFIAPIMEVHAAKGSRFVFMSGKGKTIHVGMNKPKGTGIWYSNTSYATPVVTIYNYPVRSNYNFAGTNHWMGGVSKQQELLDEQKEEAWRDWLKVNRPGVNIPNDPFDEPAFPRKKSDLLEDVADWKEEQEKTAAYWKAKRDERKKLASEIDDYGWGC
jgi:hypothetical protein